MNLRREFHFKGVEICSTQHAACLCAFLSRKGIPSNEFCTQNDIPQRLGLLVRQTKLRFRSRIRAAKLTAKCLENWSLLQFERVLEKSQLHLFGH